MEKNRTEKFFNKFSERSLDGVFSVISEGGYEEKVEVPEDRFMECFRIRTANTQDYRQGLTHTEDVGYIDVEKAKEITNNGKLHIDIPDKYMGLMIGAKGNNIKRLQNTLSNVMDTNNQIKIILHNKSQEEVKIKLEQIQKAINKQNELAK